MASVWGRSKFGLLRSDKQQQSFLQSEVAGTVVLGWAGCSCPLRGQEPRGSQKSGSNPTEKGNSSCHRMLEREYTGSSSQKKIIDSYWIDIDNN